MFLGSKIITQLRNRGELFQYLWSMALEHTYVQKQAEKKFHFHLKGSSFPVKPPCFIVVPVVIYSGLLIRSCFKFICYTTWNNLVK